MIPVDTEHRLTVQANCPENTTTVDVYATTIRVQRVLLVEDIHSAVEHFTLFPIHQEELTACLAERLRAHVTTVGEHSGVKTTCEAQG